MAYSPLPTPPPPGVPEAQAFLQRRSLVGQNKVTPPPVDATATFRTLSQAVAANIYEADQTLGAIAEAFSSRTYAVAEEHMDALRRLAELARTAYERELGIAAPVEPVAAVLPTEPEFVSPDEGVVARAKETVSAVWRVLISREKRR